MADEVEMRYEDTGFAQDDYGQQQAPAGTSYRHIDDSTKILYVIVGVVVVVLLLALIVLCPFIYHTILHFIDVRKA